MKKDMRREERKAGGQTNEETKGGDQQTLSFFLLISWRPEGHRGVFTALEDRGDKTRQTKYQRKL